MIHTITVIGTVMQEPRTMGYFLTDEKAREAIEGNHGRMNEGGSYDHLIIESFTPGIHSKSVTEKWFHWNETTGEWMSCDKPAWSEPAVNWAMG